MEILPLILLILIPILLIGVLLRKLRSEQSAAVGDLAGVESGRKEVPPSPSPVNQPNLDTMRMAVEQMDTEQIENLLEMGATLKPGAEALFRQELAKRKSPGSKSEE